MRVTELDFAKTKIRRTDDGYWEVIGGIVPPRWQEPYVGRIKIPDNLSTFYVVSELARLFGEHSVTYFNYLPPKLREMLRTSTSSVVHTMFRDDNKQQVELRVVEKPEYSLRASLMFTDYESRKRRTSVKMSDLRCYAFKEFIKPDIRNMVLVDNDGNFVTFRKEDDGSITFVTPQGEEVTLSPSFRLVVAASLTTLLGEQVRFWEFVNNVRREAIDTVLDDVYHRKEELVEFLRECAKEGNRCRKLLEFFSKEGTGSDWLDRLKDFAARQPRLVEPVMRFMTQRGYSSRASELLLALDVGRQVWRNRVKAIRPLKLMVPEYSKEEAAVSFWNDFSKSIPQPRLRFGSYYFKESIQNPIPVLFLLSIFEPD